MDIKSLSAEDQALLNTQFSPELEKEAAESVKLASELYTTGHDKLAAETADLLEKMAEEEEKEEKEEGKELNEDQKKEASVRGAFIAQGFIDGLKKLGSERYNDELAYLAPFIHEKIAAGNLLPMVVNAAKPGLGAKALELAKKHGPAAAAGGAAGFVAGRASKSSKE